MRKRLGHRRIGSGKPLFRQGDPADTLYVVESGRFRVFVGDRAGHAHVLRFVGPGEVLGEDAFMAETPQVSQPQPFSRGRTVVVPRTRIGVQEDGKKLAVVHEGVSLQQLVDGLNALGIGPLDMIAILQAIKAAGAIQADIEVM